MTIIQPKTTIRNSLKHKGFSIINVLGLAIGFSCCMYIYQYVDNELSYDRFHVFGDRIFRVSKTVETSDYITQAATTSAPLGPALANTFPEIDKVVRIKPPGVSWMLRFEDKKFYEKGFYLADSTVFEVFTFPLVAGDPRTALSNINSVVVSESMARKYFGSASPIGKVIRAEGSMDLLVTGVMRDIPTSSHLQFDFLAPFDIQETFDFNEVDDWGPHLKFYTYLLLTSKTGRDGLERKLESFARNHVGGYYRSSNLVPSYHLQPISDIHLYSHLDDEISSNSNVLYIYLFAIVACLILSVSCVNFVNLTVARSADRAKEIGLRKVFGAHRKQLIRQFLVESCVYIGVAVLLSIFLLESVFPYLSIQIGETIPYTFTNRLESWLLVLLLGVCTGVVAGGYPAFFLSRFEPVEVLYGKLRVGIRSGWLRNLLVVFQFTVSVMLIVCTLVVTDQLNYLSSKSPGYNRSGILVIPMTYTPVQQTYPVYREALSRHPLIRAVGTSTLDLITSNGLFTNVFRVAGREPVTMNTISTDAFFSQTIDLELSDGRFFRKDVLSDEHALIINETAAKNLGWTPENAIGQYMEWLVPQEWFPDGVERRREVIGVLKDFNYKSLHTPIEPLVLLYGSAGFYIYVLIDTDRAPEAVDYVSRTWNEINPEFAFEYAFLDYDSSNQYMQEQKLAYVFRWFATIAVLIACLGLLGLSTFAVKKRVREIAIRKVQGASELQLFSLLTREFIVLVLIANLIAWPLAWFTLTDWLQSFAFRYYESVPIHSLILAGIASVLIALYSIGFQTLRATSANPLESIKDE